jgi:hypothetical protein
LNTWLSLAGVEPLAIEAVAEVVVVSELEQVLP